MSRVPRNAAAVAAWLVLVWPATAAAYENIVAPGDPGATQNQQYLPTVGGSLPISELDSKTSRTPRGLPRTAARQLSADGGAGRRAAAVAIETTPPGRERSPHRALRYRKVTIARLLVSAILGSGTEMNGLLPILLAVGLLMAIMLAAQRRRN